MSASNTIMTFLAEAESASLYRERAKLSVEQARQKIDEARAALESARGIESVAKAGEDDVYLRAEAAGFSKKALKQATEDRVNALLGSGLMVLTALGDEGGAAPVPVEAPRARTPRAPRMKHVDGPVEAKESDVSTVTDDTTVVAEVTAGAEEVGLADFAPRMDMEEAGTFPVQALLAKVAEAISADHQAVGGGSPVGETVVDVPEEVSAVADSTPVEKTVEASGETITPPAEPSVATPARPAAPAFLRMGKPSFPVAGQRPATIPVPGTTSQS